MVDGDFDNGRIEVVSIDQENRIISTRVPDDNHTQDSRMRFWHLRITGMTPGERVTLRHAASVSMHYVYSYDGEIWHRFPTQGVNEISFRFVQPTVYIAPNIPYPYGRSLDLAAELAPNPHVTVSDLATSEQGRAVKLFRITDASVPDDGKRVVWIQGRQHAFESPSSFIPEGLARWMASDDPAAAEFRQLAIAYVVPVMDVDNVFHGMSGKDMPNDFNRVWNQDPPHWNAVAAAKTLLNQLHADDNLLAFIDSHNPYYTQAPHWHVAGTAANWNAFTAAYLQGVQEAGAANHDAAVAQTNVGTTPSNLGVAKNYAIVHWNNDDDFFAHTMESAHHRDNQGRFMLKEGYLQWGEALGRAFYKLLGGEELPENIPPRAALARVGTNGFTAAGSTDPDGEIVAYHWDFGDGTTVTTPEPEVAHDYDADGDYHASLRVEDNDGALSPRVSVHVPVGEIQSPFVWSAEAQQGGSSWAHSGWEPGTFRLLLKGAHVTGHASKISLTFRGRSSGSYTLRGVSIAKRDGESLNIIKDTWTELTFGGTWADGVTLPAGDWAASDTVEFDLRPGEDLFLTFRADHSTLYLNPNHPETSAWFVPNADHSTLKQWEGLSIPETRGFLYAVSEIQVKERPTDDADGNGLPDAWERHWFEESGQDPDAPAGDSGMTVKDMFILGGDPIGGAPLKLTLSPPESLRFPTKSAEAPWYGGRERTYQIERAESLQNTEEDAWMAFGDPITGTDGEVVLPPPEDPGFYRLRVNLREMH